MKTFLPLVLCFSLWIFLASPRKAHPPPTPPLALPPGTSACDLDLRLLAALPAPIKGEPEVVWIQNLSPVREQLKGYALLSGRSRKLIKEITLEAGEIRAFPSPRLPNRRGRLELENPCGIRQSIAWEEASPNEIFFSESQKRKGPYFL